MSQMSFAYATDYIMLDVSKTTDWDNCSMNALDEK
jgi:hypothetical protein